ncbi:Hsp70 family protein [Streptomycetaceae bacterium NBC_01309]
MDGKSGTVRPLLGIDFGTTTTLVTQRLAGGYSQIIPVGRSTPWMPSLIGLAGDGSLLYGEDAELVNADEMVRSVKRVITERDRTPVRVAIPAGKPLEFNPDFLISRYLEEVIDRAGKAGAVIDGAVVRLGCPAIWDAEQRNRLVAIARDACLEVRVSDIVDEPIAAGLAWLTGLRERGRALPQGKLLVFDYGGGTLDVAVLDVDQQTHSADPELTVMAARGVPEAGDALDETVAHALAEDLEQLGADVRDLHKDESVRNLLLRAARQLKMLLSDTRHDTQRVPLGDRFSGWPAAELSRDALDEMFTPQLNRALEQVRAVLCAARLRREQIPDIKELASTRLEVLADDVSHVLLAGGMSQIPLVRRRITDLFPAAQVAYDESLSAEESVGTGLVIPEGEYQRLNLHRPGFDLVLRWRNSDGSPHEEKLYEAFTALYSDDQIMRREGNLAHEYRGLVPGLDRMTVAGLHAVSADGDELEFDIDGDLAPCVPVRIARNTPLTFKLAVNGMLRIHEPDGRLLEFRINRWPVIRGRRPIVIRTPRARQGYQPVVQRYNDVYSHPWD